MAWHWWWRSSWLWIHRDWSTFAFLVLIWKVCDSTTIFPISDYHILLLYLVEIFEPPLKIYLNRTYKGNSVSLVKHHKGWIFTASHKALCSFSWVQRYDVYQKDDFFSKLISLLCVYAHITVPHESQRKFVVFGSLVLQSRSHWAIMMMISKISHWIKAVICLRSLRAWVPFHRSNSKRLS